MWQRSMRLYKERIVKKRKEKDCYFTDGGKMLIAI